MLYLPLRCMSVAIKSLLVVLIGIGMVELAEAQVPESGKAILVNLKRQTVTTYLDGKPQFSLNTVTGDKDNPTLPGKFKVVRKERYWVSRQFGVDMNFALFFDQGKAIHESQMVGLLHSLKSAGRSIGLQVQEGIGSHGCVRLDSENAKKLFEWTPLRTAVIVVEDTEPNS